MSKTIKDLVIEQYWSNVLYELKDRIMDDLRKNLERANENFVFTKDEKHYENYKRCSDLILKIKDLNREEFGKLNIDKDKLLEATIENVLYKIKL